MWVQGKLGEKSSDEAQKKKRYLRMLHPIPAVTVYMESIFKSFLTALQYLSNTI